MKVIVYTLGCKVNMYESESIVNELRNKKLDVDTKLDYADIYILNSCAVTSRSEKKSRQMVSKFLSYNKKAKIIIMGCASQNDSSQFSNKKNVDVVKGLANKYDVYNYFNKVGIFIDKLPNEYEDNYKAYPTKTRAILKIQDGCDNYCSYCIIPYVRGRSRSRDLESIICEAKQLAMKTNEIVITGINTSDFKVDNNLALPLLMTKLSNIDARIRISSLEVNVITLELLQTLKRMDNFAEHFHLSLQSGSSRVLKLMNRKYSAEEYLDKIQLIRKYFPNASITTDIIVGFAGETENYFIETLNTIRKANFFDIHIFPYSKRKGTPAYEHKSIEQAVIKQRIETLNNLRETNKLEFINSNILKEKAHEVIIETKKNGWYNGLTGNYIKCYIDTKEKLDIGGLYRVKLAKFLKDGVLATLIGE